MRRVFFFLTLVIVLRAMSSQCNAQEVSQTAQDVEAIPTCGECVPKKNYGSYGTQRSVDNLEARFKKSASGSGKKRHYFDFEKTKLSLNGKKPDAWHIKDHVQSVVRLAGTGNENFLAMTRSAKDIGDAGLFIVEFDRIKSDGGPWKWAELRKSDKASRYYYHRIPNANHAGGMQALGSLLFIAADCDRGKEGFAFVQLMDVRDKSKPKFINKLVLDGSQNELKIDGTKIESRAGAVAAIKLNDGKYLLFVFSGDGETGWFFISKFSKLNKNTKWELINHWSSTELVGTKKVWHNFQNVQFINDSKTGQIYMFATGVITNKCELYKLVERGGCLTFQHVSGRGLNVADIDDPLTRPTCRMGASVHVTPDGFLTSYVANRHGSEIAEFRYHVKE